MVVSLIRQARWRKQAEAAPRADCLLPPNTACLAEARRQLRSQDRTVDYDSLLTEQRTEESTKDDELQQYHRAVGDLLQASRARQRQHARRAVKPRCAVVQSVSTPRASSSVVIPSPPQLFVDELPPMDQATQPRFEDMGSQWYHPAESTTASPSNSHAAPSPLDVSATSSTVSSVTPEDAGIVPEPAEWLEGGWKERWKMELLRLRRPRSVVCPAVRAAKCQYYDPDTKVYGQVRYDQLLGEQRRDHNALRDSERVYLDTLQTTVPCGESQRPRPPLCDDSNASRNNNTPTKGVSRVPVDVSHVEWLEDKPPSKAVEAMRGQSAVLQQYHIAVAARERDPMNTL